MGRFPEDGSGSIELKEFIVVLSRYTAVPCFVLLGQVGRLGRSVFYWGEVELDYLCYIYIFILYTYIYLIISYIHI